MFISETRIEQAREIRTIVRELADIVPIALCSGNHDNAGRLVSHDRASVYKWFIDLATHPNVITDGSTGKLESLIVTTIPYHCSKEQKSNWQPISAIYVGRPTKWGNPYKVATGHHTTRDQGGASMAKRR